MIDTPKNESEPQPEPGGGGVPYEPPEREESGLLATREARLYGRAVRDKWYKGQRWATEITVSELTGISRERELTLKEQAVIATFNGLSNPRSNHIHTRNVIAMEAQNMEQEERDNPQQLTPQVNVNVGVSVRQEVLDDPTYLEYLRSRTLETNGNAGPVCANGKPGTLEAGQAPDVLGPGHNGHHNGQGGH